MSAVFFNLAVQSIYIKRYVICVCVCVASKIDRDQIFSHREHTFLTKTETDFDRERKNIDRDPQKIQLRPNFCFTKKNIRYILPPIRLNKS